MASDTSADVTLSPPGASKTEVPNETIQRRQQSRENTPLLSAKLRDSDTQRTSTTSLGQNGAIAAAAVPGSVVRAPKEGEEALVDTFASDNVRDWFRAVQLGDIPAVLEGLQRGIEINCRIDNRDTALHIACAFGKHPIVELLLRQPGIDINARDGMTGSTALFFAALRGDVSLCHKLLAAGADVYAINDDRMAPLHIAAKKGNADILQMLFDNGCNLNLHAVDGPTALSCAAAAGQEPTVQWLLKRGADANLGSPIPLHAARTNAREDIVALLEPVTDKPRLCSKLRRWFFPCV